MIRDLPDPQGSIRYLDASTIPLTPLSITGPSGCSTDVSTITHAPLGRSVLQDLTQINNDGDDDGDGGCGNDKL